VANDHLVIDKIDKSLLLNFFYNFHFSIYQHNRIKCLPLSTLKSKPLGLEPQVVASSLQHPQNNLASLTSLFPSIVTSQRPWIPTDFGSTFPQLVSILRNLPRPNHALKTVFLIKSPLPQHNILRNTSILHKVRPYDSPPRFNPSIPVSVL
jgi:hypothetical protein